MTKLTGDHAKLPKGQLDLIEQFETDYNAIDHFLRGALGIESHVPFIRLVNQYSNLNRTWGDSNLLRTVAKVRNTIIHGRTETYFHVAIPAPALARDLHRCRERLLNPARAIPTFQREVETVSIHDNLTKILEIVTQRDYSQFPVYEDKHFQGLLTENGITRWLGYHVTTNLSVVELDQVPVEQVLQNEEECKNYCFVARDVRVDDVSGLFASQALLEAVLITATGKESEELLGIATRWDIIHAV